MEFTAQQLTDLEELLWRASEDFAFLQEFVADPAGIVARDAGVQLPAGAGIRVLFSSDASINLVLPIPQPDQSAFQPNVIYPEPEAVAADLDQFSYLARHMPAIVSRCLEDADFRRRLVADAKAALHEDLGVEVRHDLRFVDPLEACYTLIMPRRDAASVARPVVCIPPASGQGGDPFELPGVTVHTFGQPEAASALSDDALEVVVGGASGGKNSSTILDSIRKTFGF